MKKNLLLALLCCAKLQLLQAQPCNCAETFSWMTATFAANDAGYRYVIDKKGEADYTRYTADLTQKAAKISDTKACVEVMSDWLHYFRSGHIFIKTKEPEAAAATKESDEVIRNRYKNEKTIDLTQQQLIALLEKKKDRFPIEGMWANNNYTLGIIRDEKVPKKFNAFVIKGDGVYWTPKQIKAELILKDDNKTFSSSYYMRDHSMQSSSAFFSGSSLLFMGGYWTRQYPESKLTQKEELLVSISGARLPFVRSLSAKTVYLKIPSFLMEQKRNIDSVLVKYDSMIKHTPNLIIDIRNGTGGADAAYEKLLPYLYTNPIRSVGVELYATELNANAYDNYAKQYNDTGDINYCRRIASRMRQNKGKFIRGGDGTNKVSEDSSLKVLPYPQKVGILFNRNNGSTDEQFLIDARQSMKVKTFGRPTGGMLDVSNMNRIESPDGKFVLGYCMSKSFRIPDYCIDGVGIQPDYFIDEDISWEGWVDFVQKTLER